MRWTILLLILLVACSNAPEVKYEEKPAEIKCSDGRIVVDKKLCDLTDDIEPSMDPNIEAEPSLEIIDDTKKPVTNDVDAKSAFENYVDSNSLDYTFVESEYYKNEDGTDFYKVTYAYTENGGGKNQVVVDSTGKVYMQIPII